MATKNIHVAVRIRPRLSKDIAAQNEIITSVTPGEPQIILNKFSFTFDDVFDYDSKQNQVYDTIGKSLVDGCFDGFNATIFAYGQTGSGKTHTMGTGFDVSVKPEDVGIIPRALEQLFNTISEKRAEAIQNGNSPPDFKVSAQFIEIYNEELRDLLCDTHKRRPIHITEDAKLGIVLQGAVSLSVDSVQSALEILKNGSLFRTTGATLMNSVSSRSHAIFTLFISQSKFETSDDDLKADMVRICAKFNFVDLAGSERLARTGAEGDRMKEGIKINCSLLHLGNVISKLSDPLKKNQFVNFRDSKLTRILQDSLGGNSVTTMIACISPCDYDFIETLNTLRYANRAKNIKNKAVANQDSNTQLIRDLRKRITELEMENSELRLGKMLVKEDGEIEPNDMFIENQMLKRELDMRAAKLKTITERYEEVNKDCINVKARLASRNLPDSENDLELDATKETFQVYIETIEKLNMQLQESQNLVLMYQQREVNVYSDSDDEGDAEKQYDLKLIKDELHQLNQSIYQNMKDENDTCDVDEDEEDELIEKHENTLAQQSAKLTDLINTIESKEKLILDAEIRNKQYRELQNTYESKIEEFMVQLKVMEEERDKLMKLIQDERNSKKVKQLEKEMDRLKAELRKHQMLKDQNKKALSTVIKSQAELKRMRQEVIDAKKMKVQIFNEMRREKSKFAKEQRECQMKINKMMTLDRKKAMQINNLQAQSNQQKKMLELKSKEIVALRKTHANRKKSNPTQKILPGFTPHKTRSMWHKLENRLDEIVKNKMQFEYEGRKLARYHKQKEEALKLLDNLPNNFSDDDERNQYREDVKQQIEYITMSIENCQNIIFNLDTDEYSFESFYKSLNPEEIHYVLDKLIRASLEYSIQTWQKIEELKQKDEIIKDKDAEIHRLSIHQEFLDSIISDKPKEDVERSSKRLSKRQALGPDELLYSLAKFDETKSFNKTRDSKTSNGLFHENDESFLVNEKESPLDSTVIFQTTRALKAPMTTSLTFDSPTDCLANAPRKFNSPADATKPSYLQTNDIENSMMPPPPSSISSLISPRLNRRKIRPTANGYHPSGLPVLYDNTNSLGLKSRIVRSSSINNGHTNGQNGFSKDTYSPHHSPLFTRHASNKLHYSKSNLVDYHRTPQMSLKSDSFPLICTSEKQAHSRGILSICATNDKLFTASKDSLVRLWDFQTCTDTLTISDHSDAVNVVRFNELKQQLFSVSNSTIKIFDHREGGACMKTICSSGNTFASENGQSANYGVFIEDIQISECGNFLYQTQDKIVKVYDLRTYNTVAKINTSHMSKITTMELAATGVSNTLVTGSKDHYVKLYDIENEPSGHLIPKITLQPPHYDGLEALKLAKKAKILFTGARDGFIKKFDLVGEKLISSFGLSNKNEWVLALDLFLNESLLVSGFRDGVLRLWSVENSRCYGETIAHVQSITSIATNENVCVTASSDGLIKFWEAHNQSLFNDSS